MTATNGRVQLWIDEYAQAWRERDPDAAAELFSEHAVYRSHPFRDPHLGRDGVRAYWAAATGSERTVRLRFGAPIVEGDRAAVEWWAQIEDADDGWVTLPGCLVLRFDPDGRCEELRECWHVADGRVDAPEGVGAVKPARSSP